MKLLFICNEYPPAPHGGIGVFVRSLARILSKSHHQVTVVGLAPIGVSRTVIEEDRIRVVRLKSPFKHLPHIAMGKYDLHPAFLAERVYLSSKVSSLAKQMEVDLVESYDWSGPLWTKPQAPLVVRLHGANTAYMLYEQRRPSKLLRYVERRNIGMADALVAVSQHIGDLTLKAVDLQDRGFTVIHNGVDTDEFRPIPIRKDPCRVLYVGAISERKGLFELFRSIPLVAQHLPNARFDIVGRLPDGEAGKQLLNELMALLPTNMRHIVTFIGQLPHHELPGRYCGAAVTVFPSRAEACPLAWLEAMACGAALVMTNRASGPEIIEDGVSGIIADPSQPQMLADAMIRLLQQPGLRRSLGEGARDCAVARFDLNVKARENLRYYEKVREYARGH